MSRRGFSLEFERGSNLRRGLMLLSLAAAVAALWVLAFQHTYAQPPASKGTSFKPGSVALKQPPQVLFLGDSFSSGSDMNDGPEWPLIVSHARGWIPDVNAPGGSGYVTPGVDRPLPQRAFQFEDDEPRLVVVAVGLNDVNAQIPLTQMRSAAKGSLRLLVSTFHVPVVMASPFSSGPPTPRTLAARDMLRKVCAAEPSCTFLDVTDWLPHAEVGSDGVHPTEAGHRTLAAKFDAALPHLSGEKAAS